MPKKSTKSPQTKRREENEKIISKQEAQYKKIRQESKEPFNPAASLTKVLESLADIIFGRKMGGNRAPDTAQKSLPYIKMFRDGLCKVTEAFYSKSIAFGDVNYQLSGDDSKNATYNRYCSFLNSFQTDVKLQITFHNDMIDLDALQDSVRIANWGDDQDEIREGYSKYLMDEMGRGQNEIRRTKYITFGVGAQTQKEARRRLKQIEGEILRQLKKQMKCPAKVLRGFERLRVLQETLRDNPKEELMYQFDSPPTNPLKNGKSAYLGLSGLSSKDAVAPSGFDFRHSKIFGVGDRWARASYFQVQASQLYDYALSDILSVEGASLFSLQIEMVDQEKAIRNAKATITNIGAMKVEHNKRANREGYGMDILPPDLETYEGEAAEVLASLEKKDERMFLLTFTVINFAQNKAELDNNVNQLDSVARQHGLPIKPMSYYQEQGFRSALPFANNQIEIQRGITTTGLGILIPFTVSDVNMGKGSICYGFNDTSGRMLLVNRSDLTNPSGAIVGIPGSGKSMAAKMEMSLVILTTRDDVLIVDPEGEYCFLVERLGGQVIKLSPNSTAFINPLEINMNYGKEDSQSNDYVNPVFFKTDLIFSLFEIIMDKPIKGAYRSIIDRCAREVYKPYLNNPIPENIPIFEDMYNYFKEQPESAAQEVAESLEVYVYGTLNYFNHRTNIDLNNRMVCFDVKSLQKELRDMGMLVLQDQVWNRVTINREKKKKTWYFADEFHLLLRTEQTRTYMVEIWKRFRKWGGIPTAITQNVKDFMATDDAKNILDNSPFIRILEQAPKDAEILADYLDIADDLLEYVFNPEIGGGLMRMGTTVIPFKNELPEDNILFQYITTKLQEESA